jgi:hypothetical protein
MDLPDRVEVGRGLFELYELLFTGLLEILRKKGVGVFN